MDGVDDMDRETAESSTLPCVARNTQIGYAVFRAARMHRILAGQLLRQVGLHPSQELVMMELWERGRLRQVDLAKLLDADPPTVTRTVRRLEQAGFVRRIPSPTDKRSILVEPTVASLALREKVGKLWLELEDLGTEGVGEDERMQTLMVLDRFEQNLARHKTQDAGHPDTEDPA